MSITTKGRMHNPAHPGEILSQLYLKPNKVTQEEAADALGVTRQHLGKLIKGRVPLTPEMAYRIATALGTDLAFWINLQAQHDVWVMSQKPKPDVKPLRSAA